MEISFSMGFLRNLGDMKRANVIFIKCHLGVNVKTTFMHTDQTSTLNGTALDIKITTILSNVHVHTHWLEITLNDTCGKNCVFFVLAQHNVFVVPKSINKFRFGFCLYLIMADAGSEALITLVHGRPVLWDKSLESYKSLTEKTVAWPQICVKFNSSYWSLHIWGMDSLSSSESPFFSSLDIYNNRQESSKRRSVHGGK